MLIATVQAALIRCEHVRGLELRVNRVATNHLDVAVLHLFHHLLPVTVADRDRDVRKFPPSLHDAAWRAARIARGIARVEHVDLVR